jgi:hypothetical protein
MSISARPNHVQTGTGNGLPLTVAALAEAKHLPAEFLRELGLHDLPQGGVGIPYYGPTGEEIAVKRRSALKATEGSYWPKGTPLTAYGQWRLGDAAKAGFLIVVEGESDCWVLWHRGLPALGLPGANTTKVLLHEHVEAIGTIYVHREPDRGGAAFVEGVRVRLSVLGFEGRAFELRMPDGIKDPADLHVADSQQFFSRLEDAIRASTPLQLQALLRTEAETGRPPPPSDDGVQYREGGFTLTLAKQRTKWRVVVSRGDDLLGIGVANLAAVKERRELLRSLKEVTPAEVAALEKVLIRLAVCVERDWAEYQRLMAEHQLRRQQEQSEQATAEGEARRRRWVQEIEALARDVLADPAMLHRVGEAMAGRGLVGERANALLLYLCVVSQITEEPISAVVKGDSSGGKSHLVKVVLEVVPDEAHIDLTSMSEKALIYDGRDYAHRTVVIYEVHGEGGEFSTYLIRTLISEGEIRHLTVESTPQGPVGREIVKHGPTNFITTTTLPELHAENETRIWTILVDDSPPTTRRVLAVQADRARGVFQPGDVDDLHAAFAWLHAAGAKEAVVPFADLLATAMPDKPLRLRRDFPRLLQLVKVCALLHQRQRQLDGQGRVLADLADYAMARELVAPIFLRAVAGVTEKTTELVDALERVLDEKARDGTDRNKARASYSDLVAATAKPKHYVSRWLRPALDIGLVDNDTAGEKGKAAALKLGKFRVEDGGDVLPAVGEVARVLNVDVRWVSPITGREQVLQRCKTHCNGMVFTQGIEGKPVAAGGGGSVAVSPGGEGQPYSPKQTKCLNQEESPPSPPGNTATLGTPPPASPLEVTPSGNCIPLQSELQHSATLAGGLPACGEVPREVIEL